MSEERLTAPYRILMNHLQIKEAQQKAQTYYHRIGFKLLLKTESAKNFLLNWKIIFIISFQR